MNVLEILKWVISSGNVITFVLLLMFAFGLLFLLLRGGKN